MSIPRETKARLHGGRTPTPKAHERRRDYRDLSTAVKPSDSPRPHPLRWSAWNDDRVIATAVEPEYWPAWTDQYYIELDVEPIEGDHR